MNTARNNSRRYFETSRQPRLAAARARSAARSIGHNRSRHRSHTNQRDGGWLDANAMRGCNSGAMRQQQMQQHERRRSRSATGTRLSHLSSPQPSAAHSSAQEPDCTGVIQKCVCCTQRRGWSMRNNWPSRGSSSRREACVALTRCRRSWRRAALRLHLTSYCSLLHSSIQIRRLPPTPQPHLSSTLHLSPPRVRPRSPWLRCKTALGLSTPTRRRSVISSPPICSTIISRRSTSPCRCSRPAHRPTPTRTRTP